MKYLIFLACFWGLCSTANAQLDTAAFKTIFNEVKDELAPDKRTVYLNFQMKGDTVFVETTLPKALDLLQQKTKNISGMVQVNSILPSILLNGFEYAVANLSVCNNRAAPQNAAEMMTQMILGTPVKVLKKQGGFYLVRTPDGYLSWTDATALSLMTKTEFEAWKKSKRMIYSADYGHAYSQANESASRVSDLVKGNILQITGENKSFYAVVFPDKRTAFVKKADAQLFSAWAKKDNPKADVILNTAKTLLGVPYLWGGTSVKGVDCSGFTKTSFFLNGIVIPRDASQQALVGENIEVLENDSTSIEKCLKNLQPGDLLFFAAAKLRGTTTGRITHTAIYMGNGTFIQSAGMVRINSLMPDAADFDEREYKTLVSARRFLNQVGTDQITRVNQHDWYISQ